MEEIIKDLTTRQREQYRQYVLDSSWEGALSAARKYIVGKKSSRVVFGK